MAAVGWQGAALRTLRERNRGNAAFEVLVNSCTLLALIGLPSVPVLVVPPSASLLQTNGLPYAGFPIQSPSHAAMVPTLSAALHHRCTCEHAHVDGSGWGMCVYVCGEGGGACRLGARVCRLRVRLSGRMSKPLPRT